ncbi:MAG: restriction endonuclease, partial [Phycisphaeraceae bacterium]
WGVTAWLLPAMFGTEIKAAESGQQTSLQVLPIIGMISSQAAPFIAGLVGVLWLFSLGQRLLDGQRLDRQTGIDSIHELPWREFEQLLAEAFRREGYTVELTPRGADGGIDLILSRDGEKTLVQAKHWKRKPVGVAIVREFFGVKTAEKAHECIIVTSGSFTPDAVAFAKRNEVRLIDGDQLTPMIQAVQRRRRDSDAPIPTKSPQVRAESAAPVCPMCKSKMIQRTAKKGPNAGNAFWGCSQYPKCKGTRNMETEIPIRQQ